MRSGLPVKTAFDLFYSHVKAFMMAFGQDTPTKSVLPINQIRILRKNLVTEEIAETITALDALDAIGVMDGLADIVVVTAGTLIAYGLPYDITRYEVDNFEIKGKLESAKLDVAACARQKKKLREFLDSYPDDADELFIREKMSNYCNDLLAYSLMAAAQHGCDLSEFFIEVHKSNMSKLGEDGKPIYREGDRKVLKGPNYRKPDIAKVWEEQIKLSNV